MKTPTPEGMPWKLQQQLNAAPVIVDSHGFTVATVAGSVIYAPDTSGYQVRNGVNAQFILERCNALPVPDTLKATHAATQTGAAPQGDLGAGINGWLPMETAPKDCTRVLVRCDTGITVSVGLAFEDQGHWYNEHGAELQPTHWQPLPYANLKAPANPKEGEAGAQVPSTDKLLAGFQAATQIGATVPDADHATVESALAAYNDERLEMVHSYASIQAQLAVKSAEVETLRTAVQIAEELVDRLHTNANGFTQRNFYGKKLEVLRAALAQTKGTPL